MAQDNQALTEAIEKVVDEDKLRDIIQNENEENKHNVNSAEMQTLEAEMQKIIMKIFNRI